MTKIDYGVVCPGTTALNAVAGKWKMPVVSRLFRGRKRFGELKSDLDGISSKALANTLRELETDGIVERCVVDTRPVTIEYGLTDIGYQMKPMLLEMVSWGERYLEEKDNNDNETEDGPKGPSF